MFEYTQVASIATFKQLALASFFVPLLHQAFRSEPGGDYCAFVDPLHGVFNPISSLVEVPELSSLTTSQLSHRRPRYPLIFSYKVIQ